MKYQYSPLVQQIGWKPIRLLHLLPATDRGAPLQCELVEAQIFDHAFHHDAHVKCEYQALSYTWGEPHCTQVLHVLPSSIINITENLHSALQNLRKSDKPLILWVDAICIDQENIEERNKQVGNMAYTYAEASGVLVWLGPDDDSLDGQRCLSFFKSLATLIAPTTSADVPKENWWRARFPINQAISIFLDSVQPRSIDLFLARPWFKRRWIVQEVVLAKEVIIHCGDSSIPWEIFELAMTEFFENDRGGFSKEHLTTLRIMSRIRHAGRWASNHVPLDTLVEFADFRCRNPRDRIYALNGVIGYWFRGSPWVRGLGSVDYSLSIGEVFTKFAIGTFAWGSINIWDISNVYSPFTHILQLAAAIQNQSSSDDSVSAQERCENIPSWVPDWTGVLNNTPLQHFPKDRDASCGMERCAASVEYYDNDPIPLLVMPGLVYDTILAVVPFDIGPLFGAVHEAKAALNDFLASLSEAFSTTGFFGDGDPNIYRPTSEHIISALATTLVANWEQAPPNSYFSQDPQYPGHFLEKLRASDHLLPELLHKWPAYVDLVGIMMRGRSVFLTKKGHIGICNANVQPGDLVCILSNTKIPFVFRHRKEKIFDASRRPHVTPEYYHFRNKDDRDRYVENKIHCNPQANCGFQVMGDAYVHGAMNGEAVVELGWKLGDPLTLLPVT